MNKELPTGKFIRAELQKQAVKSVYRELKAKADQERGKKSNQENPLLKVKVAQVFQFSNLSSKQKDLVSTRIQESLELISLNREQAVANTLQRFMGFGQELQLNPKTKPKIQHILEPSSDLQYKERRLAIDQGHKLNAIISESIAEGSALGFTWRHHYSNHPRIEHEELDDQIFLYRSNPLVQQLIKEGQLLKSKIKWVEDLKDLPGKLINCRCTSSYIYSVRELKRRAPELFAS